MSSDAIMSVITTEVQKLTPSLSGACVDVSPAVVVRLKTGQNFSLTQVNSVQPKEPLVVVGYFGEQSEGEEFTVEVPRNEGDSIRHQSGFSDAEIAYLGECARVILVIAQKPSLAPQIQVVPYEEDIAEGNMHGGHSYHREPTPY